MTLTETRQLLARLGMSPTKGLGQNYLVDENLARWIVDRLDLQPGEHVVEVGPGLGALTEVVLAHPARVTMTLIEFDRKTAAYWRDHPLRERLTILEADALKVDWRQFLPRRPVKFLSNLPYKGGATILGDAALRIGLFSRMVATLQKEVAERLAAEPGSKTVGPLSLQLARLWRVKLVKNLPPDVFWPRPDVTSATLVLEPREPGELAACYHDAFAELVTAAFAQRRKKLRNLVPKDLREIWHKACLAAGIDEDIRAEQVTLDQWITLTNTWRPGPELPAQDVHGEIFDVVDERNRVVRRESRHEVHRGSLRHRAVHVFLSAENAAGEPLLLLQKRSHLKDKAAGKWDSSAAGHLDAGEDYATTAARELREELGIKGSPDWIAGIPACDETGEEFVGLFELRLPKPVEVRYPLKEIETVEWFPVPFLHQWIAAVPSDFASGFITCFQAWTRPRTPATRDTDNGNGPPRV